MRQQPTRWVVKAGQDPCRKELQAIQSQIAEVAPPVGSYLPQGGPGGHCRYPEAGIPTLTAARQDPHSYPKSTRKDGEARSHRSGSFHIRPTAPDPFPAWGWDRRRHVTPRKGSPELTAEASDPPIGVRDLLRNPDPPYRVGVRSRHVSQKHGRVARARVLCKGDSLTHRI